MISTSKKSEELKKINAKLEQQSAEYLDGWKRCKADFENFKKQQDEWKNSLRLYAAEDILLEIIPVVDNFELAVNHIPQTPENKLWLEGIQHIKKQLEDILANHGARKIEVNSGDLFDPAIHECLEKSVVEECGTATAEEPKKSITIEKVIRQGYMLGEKLLRPAQVTVKNDQL